MDPLYRSFKKIGINCYKQVSIIILIIFSNVMGISEFGVEGVVLVVIM